MNVHMGNGLSGGIAGIESDVVAVRPRIQLLVKFQFDDVDQLHQRRLFCCRCFKPGGDGSFCDDEHVPGDTGNWSKMANAASLTAIHSAGLTCRNGDDISGDSRDFSAQDDH